MPIEVINSKIYSNPYQALLYAVIGEKYQPVSGSLNKAIAQLRSSRHSIYHIHWEESIFLRCKKTSDAIRERREYIQKLKRYVGRGGKVVWTLHNIVPHERRFIRSFLALRKDLAKLAHRILVHNRYALSILQQQTELIDLAKVKVLAHPSYFDVYEPADTTIKSAGREPDNPRTLLHFGMIRAYKGIPGLINELPEAFMEQHQLKLRICGKPLRADSLLAELLAYSKNRPDIICNFESVPSSDVANLFRAHAGLIIPYHDVLTSGVAVLALTLGVPTIAPNTPAMADLFPDSAHQLLFNPESSEDFRRAVLFLVNMPAETRSYLGRSYVERALSFHPKIISNELGAIYDNLLEL